VARADEADEAGEIAEAAGWRTVIVSSVIG
jgi:hypothetical protein